ncbi:hypothetical protein EW026_g5707 [Hermanssonia centrifuga]|uniref:Rhamnogalacturonase A/B/Epimerase-like pectate lyase domain-containing protein n=1 Tax=Hermanssonia centrifuga TaxID=98765 RepID=A0A4S4KDB5_9APHY|nr:hypothetical protein EW026_g5707 [Hermanssonia centrifuga]
MRYRMARAAEMQHYRVTTPIIPYYYTALVGDANNRPTLLADSNFVVIDADVYTGGIAGPSWNCPSSDPEWYCPVNNFFKSVRNFVIDTTRVPPDQYGTGLHWQVGQATSLINVHVEMSTASGNKHQGIYMENGSGGFMADLSFNGGAFGMWISNQQFVPLVYRSLVWMASSSSVIFRFTIHNVVITNADTGIFQQWNWGFTFKNIQISGCRIGFGLNTGGLTEAGQTAGSIVILDSSISATTAAVQTSSDQSSSLGGSIVLQNVDLSGSPVGVVDGSNNQFLAGGGTVNQFVLGNVYSGDTNTYTYTHVAAPGPDLPPALLDPSSSNNGVFFRTRPQYQTYAADQFISAKANGVKCDGTTDDTTNLQNLINDYWGCKIIYLDAGTCKVTSTIVVPAGTIIVGEFWTTILASGSKFSDASNPVPVLQVGNPGDTGGVEISDIVVSTTAGSAGAICIEWNVKGEAGTLGTVGMWDVHVRIGGAIGTGIQVSQCPAGGSTTSTTCQGAFLGLHVKATGSGYFENVWVWTADHDLDDPNQGQIDSFNARGIFIDHAVGPCSIILTKHSDGNTILSACTCGPCAFQSSATWNDPSWANSGSAWALNIASSSDIFIYGAGLYSFFINYSKTCKTSVSCQKSLVLVDSDSAAIYIYSLSTIGATTMLTIDSTDVISQSDNTDGLQSTVSKWSASNTTPTNPTPPSTTVGCASLQTPAKAAMDILMDPTAGFWFNRDCRNAICGHYPEPGTSSPGLSAQEWTNVNTFETIYNTMWQTQDDDYDDLIEIQTIVPNKDNGDDHVLPVTSSFSSDPDGNLRTWANKAAAWYTTGKGQTLRDTDGLWFDGTNSSCNAPDHHKWTYNQGPILSALGAMANLTGDNSYIDFALTTLDGVVNSPGTPSLPQTENGNNFLEIVNGNLAEWCDGASSSTCNNDQQYFKGAFMKHLQYFLDNVNNTVRDHYAGFVGEQG